MKVYIMTSPIMEGEITFSYNQAGMLDQLTITGKLEAQQYYFIGANLPATLADMQAFIKKLANAKFVERKRKVTFPMFWDKYNDKVRSSKKKTEIKFNKMTEGNQLGAYDYITEYDRNRGTAARMHATTYLEAELWNN